MRKIVVSTTIAASVLGAGFGAVALGPALAGAQDEAPQSETTEDQTSEAPENSASGLGEVLAELVEAGTIDQAQADAVQAAIETAAQEGRLGHGGHGGPFGRGDRGLGSLLEDLGLDPDVVRQGLADGLSLGEIAEANGSSAEAVTDALVEQMTERLDAAVEAGRIDQDTAAEMAAEIETRAAEIVSGEAGFGKGGPRDGFGGGMRHGAGRHHDMFEGDGSDDTGSDETSEGTSTAGSSAEVTGA